MEVDGVGADEETGGGVEAVGTGDDVPCCLEGTRALDGGGQRGRDAGGF